MIFIIVIPISFLLRDYLADPLQYSSTATPTDVSLGPAEDEDPTKADNPPTSPLYSTPGLHLLLKIYMLKTRVLAMSTMTTLNTLNG